MTKKSNQKNSKNPIKKKLGKSPNITKITSKKTGDKLKKIQKCRTMKKSPKKMTKKKKKQIGQKITKKQR